MPTSRRQPMTVSSRRVGNAPARSRSDAQHRSRPQADPRRGSHSCAVNGPDLNTGRPTSLMRDNRDRVRCDHQIDETRPHQRGLPQCATRRHHPNQPGRQCNPPTPHPEWIPAADVAYMCACANRWGQSASSSSRASRSTTTSSDYCGLRNAGCVTRWEASPRSSSPSRWMVPATHCGCRALSSGRLPRKAFWLPLPNLAGRRPRGGQRKDVARAGRLVGRVPNGDDRHRRPRCANGTRRRWSRVAHRGCVAVP